MIRIVLIDDDAELLSLMTEILNQSGYDAVGLNGIACINQLNDLDPALVLLDMKMPLLSGEEVLRLMRQTDKLRAIPVIIITALPQQVNWHIREMAQGLLSKPCSIEQLLQQISQVLPDQGEMVCGQKTDRL